MCKKVRWRGLLLAMAAGLTAGCASTSSAPPPGQRGGVGALPVAGGNDSPETIDQAVLTDASAVRLDDIVEAILLYFSANKGMAPRLEELRTMPGEENLNLTAPSGQEYYYAPQGLSSPAGNKLLIVYDPMESANGKRWCILASQLRQGAPLTAEVIALPEIVFRAYLASNP
jgi:hypothetical protein